MIVQPTHEQTRRVTRSRIYSGPGFGPRSFECLGIGLGLGLGFSFASSGTPNPLTILGAAATKLWLRPDLGLSYGSALLATAGNASTSVLTLTGALAGSPVPIWAKSTNTLAVGSGATFSIYYDGTGTTPAMIGVTPIAATPIALTGAGAGLSIAWTAGTSVSGDTWKATGASGVDQSGNWGANFAQATAANQPLVTLDSTINQLALAFDGVNDVWASTGLFPVQGTTPYAMIVVAKIPSYAGSGKPLIGADSYGPGLCTQAASTFGPQAGALGPPLATPSTAWKRIILELTNSTSDRLQQGAASATGVNSGPSRQTNSYLGGIPTSSAWLACSIAEVIVVTPIPVSYTTIDAYISALYGASLLT